MCVLLSKRLAQKLRSLQAISPRQFDGFGNSDPHACDDLGFLRARMQRDRRNVEREAIMRAGDAERLLTALLVTVNAIAGGLKTTG